MLRGRVLDLKAAFQQLDRNRMMLGLLGLCVLLQARFSTSAVLCASACLSCHACDHELNFSWKACATRLNFTGFFFFRRRSKSAGIKCKNHDRASSGICSSRFFWLTAEKLLGLVTVENLPGREGAFFFDGVMLRAQI